MFVKWWRKPRTSAEVAAAIALSGDTLSPANLTPVEGHADRQGNGTTTISNVAGGQNGAHGRGNDLAEALKSGAGRDEADPA